MGARASKCKVPPSANSNVEALARVGPAPSRSTASRTRSSTRMQSPRFGCFDAAAISLAAKFTLGPMTAYSHLNGAPTKPQNVTPTVMPQYAAMFCFARARTKACAYSTARRSLSSKELPRTPKHVIATQPLSSTMNCRTKPPRLAAANCTVPKHSCTVARSPCRSAAENSVPTRFVKHVVHVLCSARCDSSTPVEVRRAAPKAPSPTSDSIAPRTGGSANPRRTSADLSSRSLIDVRPRLCR
mmetsp:Transcript_16461/g.55566  ORF Transcript_16461/g.55566 Transcript_16461/m.55566 type:complete len:243 (-) Transcript_16461:66-794(-)